MADWQSQSLTNLNAMVLSLIECRVCTAYAQPPIKQCSTGHIMCSNCLTKYADCSACKEGTRLIRNFALEHLSTLAVYPCEYKSDGCEKTMDMAARSEHILVCPYRPYECRIGKREGCRWKGRRNQIIAHAKESHKNSLYEEEYIRFSFNSEPILESCNIRSSRSSLEISVDSIYIINAHDQPFYMILRFDRDAQKLYVAVQYIGPEPDSAKYVYKVKFTKSQSPEVISFKLLTHAYSATMDSISTSRDCAHMDYKCVEKFIEDSKATFELHMMMNL